MSFYFLSKCCDYHFTFSHSVRVFWSFLSFALLFFPFVLCIPCAARMVPRLPPTPRKARAEDFFFSDFPHLTHELGGVCLVPTESPATRPSTYISGWQKAPETGTKGDSTRDTGSDWPWDATLPLPGPGMAFRYRVRNLELNLSGRGLA